MQKELLKAIRIEKKRCEQLLAQSSSSVQLKKITELILKYLDSLSGEVCAMGNIKKLNSIRPQRSNFSKNIQENSSAFNKKTSKLTSSKILQNNMSNLSKRTLKLNAIASEINEMSIKDPEMTQIILELDIKPSQIIRAGRLKVQLF
ncbi:hypothetical protein [Bizionia myxarmorum]|uniref:Uncharacterized protein n=1 Tax=Bizionia myxarmorum TaxID=291186 RepID=A0A5D0R059_9FLAO|nr:hypothetical protein [Bizionia myxarmorum]TYB74256.1 hypothetical protein ES674_13950 [Bizionia myxarmorum]